MQCTYKQTSVWRCQKHDVVYWWAFVTEVLRALVIFCFVLGFVVAIGHTFPVIFKITLLFTKKLDFFHFILKIGLVKLSF